jgi:hypothetical protein
MPATEGSQAEGGLGLTAVKKDMELDLGDRVADGPEIAALYLVDTELPVKIDESTASVVSQEVWEQSLQLYWQKSPKKSWSRSDNKRVHMHGAV